MPNFAHAKKEKLRSRNAERVKNVFSSIHTALRGFLLRFPSFKYSAICKACGLREIDWQRRYALGKAPMPSGMRFFRATGKTTAMVLKLLMLDPVDAELKCSDILNILADDPDFRFENPGHINAELKLYTAQALQAGIKVPTLNVDKLIKEVVGDALDE